MWARAFAVVAVVSLLGGGSANVETASEVGFLQVNADPGVEVFIDGEHVGTTSEEARGLFVLDVPAGERRVRFQQDGFEAREVTVAVIAGRVSVYDVAQFAPSMRVHQAGQPTRVEMRRLTGTLVVQTLPVESVLDLPGLGLREQVKSSDVWQVDQVPEGSYSLTVSALGREVQSEVVVVDRHETRVFVALGSDPPLVRSVSIPIPTHAVARIGPDTIRSSESRQRVEIHGRGFRPGSVVFVYWGEREFEIPPERTTYVDATRIDVEVGLFPADTSWAVVVVDPDGVRAERFGFTVVD